MNHENLPGANQSPADKAGPHPARDKDNLVVQDDIGLPSGIQPDEVSKLNEVNPDPEKLKNKS